VDLYIEIKRSEKKWYNPLSKSTDISLSSLGYAFVTGASRGIGRAFAVELARYEIPLILVARDETTLKALALDIQTAYGVPCVIIKADLSEKGTAKRIYETTKEAGLKVDILINNAGVCTSKDIVQVDEGDIERMMDVNVRSTTILSQLYAKEMKNARRGRILFVSSMVGAMPSGPGVATYAATKAYEKSLAQSMGRELEKYGVGVTCLMPGAVEDTSFAARSDAQDAICFKVPLYPLKPQQIASTGVRSLLYSGDGEVIPGWPNRFFLKILMPILPPRLTSSIVALAWSPVRLPFGIGGHGGDSSKLFNNINNNTKDEKMETMHDRMSSMLYDRSPRILELPGAKQMTVEEIDITDHESNDKVDKVNEKNHQDDDSSSSTVVDGDRIYDDVDATAKPSQIQLNSQEQDEEAKKYTNNNIPITDKIQ